MVGIHAFCFPVLSDRFREILHDPERYEDPFVFKPERFLNPTPEKKDEYPYDPFSYVFGFGRR